MTMTRTTLVFCTLLFSAFASACGQDHRPPLPPVDCSVEDAYDFDPINYFTAGMSGWYAYSDPTPGGAPNPYIDSDGEENSNVLLPGEEGSRFLPLEPPGRCGDTAIMILEMYGKNFWGAGFGNWDLNANPRDGRAYEGISFWARSPINFEKEFLFNVDDVRTMINPPPDEELPAEENPCGNLPAARAQDEDLDGDGCLGPGDIVDAHIETGTRCRLPPPEDVGDVPCYNGGVDSPASGGVRVPAANECGNAFHTRINLTEQWQLFTIPWDELVQWPCPNRLAGGIDPENISKFEIKLTQGMNYQIWIDNIAFYRSRGN